MVEEKNYTYLNIASIFKIKNSKNIIHDIFMIYYLEQIAHGLFAPPIFCKHDQHLTSPHFLHLYKDPDPPWTGHLPDPLLVIVVGISNSHLYVYSQNTI
tara:strand:+ start:236 stop:532 length:297 start_codon:yes stop_codon:yes gene_type:complete